MKCFLLFSELLVLGIELFKPLCIPEKKKEEKLVLALNWSNYFFSREFSLACFIHILGKCHIITNIKLKINKASVSD